LLHFAALENQPFITNAYLERHYDILPKNVKHQTPIHLASLSGSLDFIKTLAKETLTRELDKPDVDGHTPLMLAAMHGHINVLGFLLKQNVNVNHQDIENEDSQLHFLVKRERNEALEFVLKWNAQEEEENGRLNIDLKNKQGRTALHCAADCANEEAIYILCSFDADTSMLDLENMTPLNLAIQSKCPHIEKRKQSLLALLKCGVDYNQIDIDTIDEPSLKDLITNYMTLNVELSAPLLSSLLNIYTGDIQLNSDLFRFQKSRIDYSSAEIPHVIFEFYSKGSDRELEFFKSLKLSFSSLNASGDNVFHVAVKSNDKKCLEKLFDSEISRKSLMKCDVKNNKGEFVLDLLHLVKNEHDKNELAALLHRNNFKNTSKSPDKSSIFNMLFLLSVVFCVIVIIMDMKYFGLI
jgi:ankyrin repeat protein